MCGNYLKTAPLEEVPAVPDLADSARRLHAISTPHPLFHSVATQFRFIHGADCVTAVNVLSASYFPDVPSGEMSVKRSPSQAL